MIDIKRLLRFTPDEAILMLANEKMNTYLRPEISKVSQLKVISGSRTQVLIESRDIHPAMIQNPYIGASVLEYSRYDLTAVFGAVVSDLQVPTSVESLLEAIHKATGIVFTKEDFNNEAIETKEFWLNASPSSKRWIGSVKVTFDDSALGTRIGKYLSMNSHEGLTNPEKVPSWVVFYKDILDGLELGKPHISFNYKNTTHGGLVSDIRIKLDEYILTNDHVGLIAGLELSEYLPVKDHIGLTSSVINNYLNVKDHSGLFGKNVSSYLRVKDHGGLQSGSVESYLRVSDHQGLFNNSMSSYLPCTDHLGLGGNDVSKYLSVTNHSGLVVSNISHYLSNTSHLGLKVGLSEIDGYLTTSDHGGLTSFITPSINGYLNTHTHVGLNVIKTDDIQSYLSVNRHGGLNPFNTGIETYLPASVHKGLNVYLIDDIGSYIPKTSHSGLSIHLNETAITKYLAQSNHGGLIHNHMVVLKPNDEEIKYNVDGYEL